MAEHDDRTRRTRELALKPRELLGRHVCVVPGVVAGVVAHLGVVTGVQHDEGDALAHKGVVRQGLRLARVLDVREIVLEREAVEVVVAEHVEAVAAETGERALDGVEAREGLLASAREVLEVAELDEEVGLHAVHHVHGLLQLATRLAVVAVAHRRQTRPHRDVRVVEVRDHAEAHERAVGAFRAEQRLALQQWTRRACAGQPFQKRSSLHFLLLSFGHHYTISS